MPRTDVKQVFLSILMWYLLNTSQSLEPTAAQDMEALEVDDVSPALEVTEDFFNSFDTKLEKIV